MVHAEGLSDKCRQTRVRLGLSFKKIKFVYLSEPGFSCSTWVFSPLACELSVATCKLVNSGIWDLVPGPELEPGPQHWEHEIFATGLPGKSQAWRLLRASSLTWWYLS